MGKPFYGCLVENLEHDMYVADERNTSFVRLSFEDINNIICTLKEGQEDIENLEKYNEELNSHNKELFHLKD